ncbi:hypothetical protein KQI86_19140 [Clostridium sp. MSJ-11]|uniref:Uncharacterized protein n=1 Tax=Clostridium mobile TaxID=2841512 RepID=A0ABS6EMG1_9CLOT|nr:hypothetical protein [Clostridium mobile]MBU5486419.1 hypothetical protein [Clostridium mobile]
MLEKIKLTIRRLKCKHDMEINRWHWVHYPESEPSSVEAEYKCNRCGKLNYIHLYDKEAEEWSSAMGEYKKV